MFSEGYIIKHVNDQTRDRQKERSQANRTDIGFMHSSFNKLFFSTLDVAGAVLGTRNTTVNMTSKVLVLMEANGKKQRKNSFWRRIFNVVEICLYFIKLKMVCIGSKVL